MKFVIVSLLALLSFNAFAEITSCSGKAEGKKITFTITTDKDRVARAMSVSIDGALVSKKLTEVRSIELAGGIMITASEPWAIAINDVSVFVDEKRNCFDRGSKGCYLGWVNLYQQDLVIRGIKLKCR